MCKCKGYMHWQHVKQQKQKCLQTYFPSLYILGSCLLSALCQSVLCLPFQAYYTAVIIFWCDCRSLYTVEFVAVMSVLPNVLQITSCWMLKEARVLVKYRWAWLIKSEYKQMWNLLRNRKFSKANTEAMN